MAQNIYILNVRFDTVGIVMNKPGFKFPDELPKEKYLDFEREHYRDKMHFNPLGRPMIPRTAIAKTLANASQFLTNKAPSGFKTWRKLVESCLIVIDDFVLECDDKQITRWETNVRNQGKAMVWTVRPMVMPPVSAGAKIAVLDERLTRKVLDDLIDLAGKIVGFMSATKLGYGRTDSITLQEVDLLRDKGNGKYRPVTRLYEHMATGTYGQRYSHAEIQSIIERDPQHEGRSVVLRVRARLLRYNQKLLLAEDGYGYYIARPEEHADYAEAMDIAGTRKKKKGLMATVFVDTGSMTPEDIRRLADKQVKLRLELTFSQKIETLKISHREMTKLPSGEALLGLVTKKKN